MPLVMPIKIPRKASIPARVTINDGTLRYATHQPFQAPSNRPSTSVTAIVSGSGQPSQTSKIAATPPSRPIIDPTDRSISAEIMTKTIPTARMPVMAVWRSRFETLRALKYEPSVIQVKNNIMAIIAAIITKTCRLSAFSPAKAPGVGTATLISDGLLFDMAFAP